MKYIAYGSNMNQEQFVRRCPGAQLIGTVLFHGYQLEINPHATIVESSVSMAPVPVTVWEITPEHEARLDQYEGFPLYYRKLTCQVEMAVGEQVEGMVYQMNWFIHNPPSNTYFQVIREAYESLGLRSEIKTTLQPALMRSQQLARG